MSDVPAGFVRPFKYDGWEFIFDADGNMAADLYEGAIRPRGWGRIQYLPNPHLTMNEWEFWLKRKVGDCTEPEEVVRRMNAEEA